MMKNKHLNKPIRWQGSYYQYIDRILVYYADTDPSNKWEVLSDLPDGLIIIDDGLYIKDSEEAKAVESSGCECSMLVLMRDGCKCGGI